MKRNPAWNGQGDWCGFPCVEMNRVRSCLGLRSALHCLLLRACAPWIYVCAAFKAHLCPDKQIFMITTREGAVRTLFFQTRHTEKCYQIAQLRSQGKKTRISQTIIHLFVSKMPVVYFTVGMFTVQATVHSKSQVDSRNNCDSFG